jgi:hypothetical protein
VQEEEDDEQEHRPDGGDAFACTQAIEVETHSD